jgi:prepilin-type N-terminal cleavage/methylation domain-containing protein
MRSHRERSTEQGFTMIEVMIAILLSAIAVIGGIGLFTAAARGANVSRHSTEASVLAEDKVEVLRTVTAPASGSESGPIDALGQTGTGGLFTRVWTVGAFPACPSAATASTVPYGVVVSWSEDGIARSVSACAIRNL